MTLTWAGDPEIYSAMVAFATVTYVLMLGSPWATEFGLGGAGLKGDLHLKAVEWERERMLSLAKGIGSTAAGFLVTLITLAIELGASSEADVFAAEDSQFSIWIVVGLVGGAISSLVFAGSIWAESRRFALQELSNHS